MQTFVIFAAAMQVHFRTKKRANKLKDQELDVVYLQNQRRRSRINTVCMAKVSVSILAKFLSKICHMELGG